MGDTIHNTITINPPVVEGSFELKLICGDNSETFYKISPAESAFTANQETKLNHKIILEKQYIGECQIAVNLGKIIAHTEKFRISSDISVNVKTDKEFYDPGEAIVISIEATKPNGQKLEGFVRADGTFSFEKKISGGYLREVLTTEKTREAGEYTLNLFLFDEDDDKNILNSKNTSLRFRINQVAQSVPITLQSLEINPGEQFEFQAEIFDQSGKSMDGLISIEFISPLKEKIQLSVNSKEGSQIYVPTNATPGEWKLQSSYGSIKEERIIRIREKPLLDFEFLEGSSVLNIKNIGNAAFVGPVNISFGGESKELVLNIKPGEERKFTLTAPNGEYDVKVSGGEKELEKKLLLTGKAINVKDYGKFLIFSEYPAVWSIIFTLIILLAIILFFRYNKKTFSINKKIRQKIEKMRNMGSDSSGKKILEYGNNRLDTAEAALVINGTREPSTVLNLKIKNEIQSFTRENLEKVLKELSQKSNAVIDSKENEFFIIFSPRKTRTYKNEYGAIKLAMDLKMAIEEMNRKYNGKIDFGIGIGSGDLVSNIEKGKLRYTGVDGTISLARRIADLSNKEVLVSERVKNKLLREIRTERIEKAGNTYYKILRISERDTNQEKLKDLLKRTNMK